MRRSLHGCCTSSTLSQLWYSTTTPLNTTLSQQEQQEKEKEEEQKLVDGGIPPQHYHSKSSHTSSTYIGTQLSSYMLSPVMEERHCLWQWRTVVCRNSLYAVPFLLHCAPSVPLRRPFLHPSAVDCIYTHIGWKRNLNSNNTSSSNNNNNTGSNNTINNTTIITKEGGEGETLHTEEKWRRQEENKRRRIKYSEMSVPTPIGALPVIDDAIMTDWVNEVFHFLEKGEKRMKGGNSQIQHVYTDVFEQKDGELQLPTPPTGVTLKTIHSTNTHSNNNNNNNNNSCTNNMDDSTISYLPCTFPASHRNVIGCGLAEVIVAIDRYAAMLARRDITYAKACWAVLVDSKADVQPYLRYNAIAIEKDLIAGAKAHEAINAAMGDPVRRPLLKLADYPSLAGW